MSASATIHDTLDRLNRWLRAHQPTFLDAMRPGATDTELNDLERAVGRTLPEDVRAFYRWRAGIDPQAYAREHSPFWERPLTLNEIKGLHREWCRRAESFWRDPDFGPGWWHPAWVPFLGDEDDGCFCTDTAGIWTGVRGQIIAFQVSSVSRSIVAGSVHDWLRILVADLERGRGYDSDTDRVDTLSRHPLGYPQRHDAWEPAVVPEPTPKVVPAPVVPDKSAAAVGDRVRIRDGTFVNSEGGVVRLEAGTWRIMTRLTFWGRPVDVELEFAQFELVERTLREPPVEDWLDCSDSRELFSWLGFAPSVRKLRLFVAACCRIQASAGWEASYSLPVDSLCWAIEEASENVESVADFRDALDELWHNAAPEDRRDGSLVALLGACCPRPLGSGRPVESLAPALLAHVTPDLLREIFPNPFAPPRFDPAWRTPDVSALARGIYGGRAFDGLPVLADALQEAGCDNDELLAHLRDTSQPHVRGCRALDLCLGRE